MNVMRGAEAALADDERAQPSAPRPPAREDEPELGGAAAELVLDDERQQHLGRAHEQQVGERRATSVPQSQRVPRTNASPSRIVEQRPRRPPLRGARGRGRIEQQRDAETTNDAASSANAEPAPNDADQQAAERRPGEPEGDRPHELVERVGLGELARARGRGTIASNAGAKNAVPRAVERDERDHVPELQRAR